VATSTDGINNPGTVDDFETAVARWSFSDVDQLLSKRPNAPLGGGPVGVVPFMFVAGEGSPSGLDNMTDQIHNALWKQGVMSASIFTGDAEDTGLIYATGRSDGSGTRATILAETQYGAFTPVIQFNCVFEGDRSTGTLTGNPTLFAPGGNGGNQSNSGVRDLLTRPGTGFSFVSYLTVSDALPATGYDPETGISTGGEGATAMTYNGQRYSVDNVRNGAYSLWGYQQFYAAPNLTPGEQAFDTALRDTIPSSMGTAGIPIPDMAVERSGGDGGLISPL
jgi:ABC-type phosphate transport system substrate-binding protein